MEISMKGLIIIILQMVARGNSIQCYQSTKDDDKILKECKGVFDISRDIEIKVLKCILNQGRGKDIILASKYLDLYQKCLAKYDSCFYTDVYNNFDCTCPYMYVTWIQPETFIAPTMKVGECKKHDETSVGRAMRASSKAADDVRYLAEKINEPRFNICRPTSSEWTFTMEKLEMAKKSRSKNTYVACTCASDGCDASAVYEDTSKSDTSDTSMTMDMDSDESTEKSVFSGSDQTSTIHTTEPEIETKPTVETDSDNEDTNVTKDIEPNNDKTTVSKVDGSDNDDKMITTKSGTTQQFYSECFPRILIGEIIITFLVNHLF